MISVTAKGYMNEFEIKVSKSDFKADKLKKKHADIEFWMNGVTETNFVGRDGYVHPRLKRNIVQPANRLWYVVPEFLITAAHVNSLHGLIYVSDTGHVKIIKQAPLLHKTPMPESYKEQIARSYMWRYWRLRNKHGEKREKEDLSL